MRVTVFYNILFIVYTVYCNYKNNYNYNNYNYKNNYNYNNYNYNYIVYTVYGLLYTVR